MTLQDQLRELIEKKGLTASAVARSLGISASALSQWLDGKYGGNVERVDRAVKGFLQRWQEKQALPAHHIPFIMTSVVNKTFEMARFCHLENEIGVLVGPAGVGKTWAVQEYVRQNTDVVLLEVDPGYTASSLFKDLARKLGFLPNGNLHDVFEDVVERLRGSGRLIIIDEAEHLPYRALELLRRVYDKAGIGILLVGMPRLIENLRGRKGEYQQLYSRVGIYANLQKLHIQDAEAIVNQVVPEANGLCRIFYDLSTGNTRVLTKLIKRSLRIAGINDKPLNQEVVMAAARTLII